MKQKIMKSILFLLLLFSVSRAQNVMWIDSVSSGANQTVNFSVYVANAQPFVAFQLDILLPNVLSYINNSAALTARADGHSLSANLVESQKLRVLAYSMTAKKFLGNQGAVLTFQCQTKTQPGTYPLQIQNAVLADTSLQNILNNTYNGRFVLLAPDIKTNVDSLDFGSIPLGQTSERSITISNIGTTQLSISKLSSTHLEIRFLDSNAVNINPNSSIIRTLRFQPVIKGSKSGRIEIISNDPDEMNKILSYKAHAYAVNEVRIGSAFGRSGFQATLNISINNMEPFTAFEFRIQLPSAAKYVNGSAVLTSKKVDHIVFADTAGGNILRVVAYSPTNKNFTGTDGDIVQVTLNLSGTGGYYTLPISNAMISDTTGMNIISASYSGSLQIASPTISLSTTNLNFGQVSILDTARSTIRVYNNGSDTLKVTSITSNNTLFANETAFPFQVQPGAYKDVTIKFHSSHKGVYNGELKVYHNDVVRNPSTIIVSATAFAPNRLKVISVNGGMNQIISLPFEITNTEQFVAFQFDVTLPSQIVYQSGTVQLSSRKQDHAVTASILPNGKLRVIAYSMSQAPFLGSAGEVVRFNVQLPSTTGTYQITLSDVIIGSAEVGNIASGFDNGTINMIAPPTSPSLNSPLNGAVNQPRSLTLLWNTVSSVDYYHLQVSADSLFTALIVNDSLLTTNSRLVSSLDYLTKYYWRVRSKNIGGESNWSNVWNFTTIIAIPAIPILLSPSNNSVHQPITLTLSWNASDRAEKYNLQVSTDSLFGTTIVDDTTITGTSRLVSSLANLTKYYWRVRANNVGGVSGWSTVWNFITIIEKPNIPQLVSPTNGSISHPTTLSIKWNKSPRTEVYHVQVSTDSIFTSFIINDSTITDTSKQLSSLNYNQRHFWRVSADNIGGKSGWSSIWNFTTISDLISTTVDVNSGWNMLSVPVLSASMNVDSLFPGRVTPAYYYDNGYVSTITLQNTKGYWLKFNNSNSYSVQGIAVTPRTIPVNSNWNMIGPFETDVNVSGITTTPPGIIVTPFYGYNNGYQTATTLQRGKGYWIKVSQNGVLNLPTSIAKTSTQQNCTGINPNWIKLSVTDKNNSEMKLFLTKDQIDLTNFELPPSPPTGIFDVRFVGDRFVESQDRQKKVMIINSASYPVKLRIEGLSCRISDEIDGSLLNKTINDGDEIEIYNSQLTKFGLMLIDGLPVTYKLYQNYPNPFNPTTIIKFAIPEKSHVKLSIFNSLGEKLIEVVNSIHEAGYHESNLMLRNYHPEYITIELRAQNL